MMNNTDEKIAQLIEKLQNIGFDNAPEVMAGTIIAIRYEGAVQIIFGFIFIAISIAAIWLLKWANETGTKNPRDDWPYLLGGFTLGMAIPVSLLLFISENPWLKFFNPQASLYKKIIWVLF